MADGRKLKVEGFPRKKYEAVLDGKWSGLRLYPAVGPKAPFDVGERVCFLPLNRRGEIEFGSNPGGDYFETTVESVSRFGGQWRIQFTGIEAAS